MRTLIHPTGKKMLMTAVLALVVVAAGTALAQGPGVGKGHGCGFGGDCQGVDRGEMRMERMVQRLDLTEEQAESIAKIREEGRSANAKLRKEMMRLRNELQGELLKDDPSRKSVLDLNEKMGALRTQMRANRLENRLAVREQLTPEQRDRMLLSGESGRGGQAGRGDRCGMHSERGRGGCDGPARRGHGGRPGSNPDCPLNGK